jgi:large subunit ribosomal protein L10
MATTTTHKKIPTVKLNTVEQLANLIKSSAVLGIAKAEGIGAKQIQRLRRLLEGEATLKVTKNTLMRLAVRNCEDEKADIAKLEQYLVGSNIFIFAKMDPFKLTRILDQNKMRTLAKPGHTAPEDIVVPAGNTGFPPGPLITEFGNVGLPTKIDAGNIAITKDTVVAKEGDTISRQLALVLSRLGIEPMEVGLVIDVAYEDGALIHKDQLQIDVEEIRNQFLDAASQALNLATNIAYPTPETVQILIQKAFMDSMRLAETASFITPETLPAVLMKANMQMLTLASKIGSIDPSVVPEEIIKTTPETPPPEETKPEVEEKKPSEPEEEEGGLGDLFG